MSTTKSRLTLSEPLAATLLLVLAIACAFFLFAQPRKVLPGELPILTLPAGPVRDAMRADARDAASAPATPEAHALLELMRQQGEAEDRGFEDADVGIARRGALREAFLKLVERAGQAAALRLRAKAVQTLEEALALRLPPAQTKTVMGAFASNLAQDGVTRDGHMVAPHFVVRTLYKARWNVMVGEIPDRAFKRIERRAFHGYQALHAERVPLNRRVEALHAYGLVGGEDLEEALGGLLFRSRQFAQSARAFEAAYQVHGSLRLRNNALAARAYAGIDD
jgi:hypothetical protein